MISDDGLFTALAFRDLKKSASSQPVALRSSGMRKVGLFATSNSGLYVTSYSYNPRLVCVFGAGTTSLLCSIDVASDNDAKQLWFSDDDKVLMVLCEDGRLRQIFLDT
jgi:hypothetical protein